jgi:hypothetical protein
MVKEVVWEVALVQVAEPAVGWEVALLQVVEREVVLVEAEVWAAVVGLGEEVV